MPPEAGLDLRGRTAQMLTDEFIDFCLQVKWYYLDRPEIYSSFCKVIERRTLNVIDLPQCVDELRWLFVDNLSLIKPMGRFMHPSLRIEIHDPNDPNPVRVISDTGRIVYPSQSRDTTGCQSQSRDTTGRQSQGRDTTGHQSQSQPQQPTPGGLLERIMNHFADRPAAQVSFTNNMDNFRSGVIDAEELLERTQFMMSFDKDAKLLARFKALLEQWLA